MKKKKREGSRKTSGEEIKGKLKRSRYSERHLSSRSWKRKKVAAKVCCERKNPATRKRKWRSLTKIPSLTKNRLPIGLHGEKKNFKKGEGLRRQGRGEVREGHCLARTERGKRNYNMRAKIKRQGRRKLEEGKASNSHEQASCTVNMQNRAG